MPLKHHLAEAAEPDPDRFLQIDPVFGVDVVTECPGVPSEILVPRDTWADKAAFDAAERKLAGLFRANFEKYAAGVSAEIAAAGPA